MIDLHESLTSAAREALALNAAQAYGSLAPAGPFAAAKPLLERLPREGAVVEVGDREMDRAAVAGLWLWHDFLDESHTISQGLETPEGSLSISANQYTRCREIRASRLPLSFNGSSGGPCLPTAFKWRRSD